SLRVLRWARVASVRAAVQWSEPTPGLRYARAEASRCGPAPRGLNLLGAALRCVRSGVAIKVIAPRAHRERARGAFFMFFPFGRRAKAAQERGARCRPAR